MTTQEAIDYTDTLPMAHALWWYLENAEDEWGSEVFFRLRTRFRAYQDNPRPEWAWEATWRKL